MNPTLFITFSMNPCLKAIAGAAALGLFLAGCGGESARSKPDFAGQRWTSFEIEYCNGSGQHGKWSTQDRAELDRLRAMFKPGKYAPFDVVAFAPGNEIRIDIGKERWFVYYQRPSKIYFHNAADPRYAYTVTDSGTLFAHLDGLARQQTQLGLNVMRSCNIAYQAKMLGKEVKRPAN